MTDRSTESPTKKVKMSDDNAVIRIGTRDSALAMWQANLVQARLSEAHPSLRFELVSMKTLGDKILDVPISQIGATGVFTKELERGLLNGEIDIAVHCVKDMPSKMPPGLELCCYMERHDPEDVLVLHERNKEHTIDNLPKGAVLGTSSVRRKAQIMHEFPGHFAFKDIRGNLQTRLKKLDSGDYDAIVLAKAGLERMGLNDRITSGQILPLERFMHCPGQGALTVQCCEGNTRVSDLLKPLQDERAVNLCAAERSLMVKLEGSCQLPLAVWSKLRTEDDAPLVWIRAAIYSEDGAKKVELEHCGPSSNASGVGLELAEKILAAGGKEIIASLKTERAPTVV